MQRIAVTLWLILVAMALAVADETGIHAARGADSSPLADAVAELHLPLDGDSRASVQKLQLSADGRLAASRDSDWRILLWDVDSGKTVSTIAQTEDRIDQMAFSLDGQFLITAAPMTSERIRSWNVVNGLPIGEIAHAGQLLQILDQGIVQAVGEQELIQFQAPSGPVMQTTSLRGIHNAVPLQLSPDGQLLLLAIPDEGGIECHLELYDLRRHERRRIDALEHEPISAVVTRSGELVAAVHRQGTLIHAWSSPPISSTIYLAGHRDLVQTLHLTPDELFLVSGGADGVLRMWDLIANRSVAMISLADTQVSSVSVSADGRRLAAGLVSDNGADLVVWEIVNFLQAFSELSAKEFVSVDEALSALGGDDGHVALLYLLEHLDQAFPVLEKRLQQRLAPLDEVTVRQHLTNLDSPDFHVREQAYRSLFAHRFQIRDRLRAAAERRVSLETMLSLQRLLQQEDHPLLQELPRLYEWRRTVYLLERQGSRRARALLSLLRNAHTDERIRKAADAAEQRLDAIHPLVAPVDNS